MKKRTAKLTPYIGPTTSAIYAEMGGVFPPHTLRTLSGVYIDISEPKFDDFNIEDIAHGLSQVCRFAGQTPTFYSVAQHSIIVSEHVPKMHAMAGLMHDASEFILGDIASPLKKLLPNYKNIENEFMHQISLKFNFEWPLPETVKKTDKNVYEMEAANLIKKTGAIGNFAISNPIVIKKQFLDRYYYIFNRDSH